MRLLFVHERFGAFGGAEANVLVTASELQSRGHTLAILHGPSTGKDEEPWRAVFTERFALPPQGGLPAVRAALSDFRPDVVFMHKMADLSVVAAFTEADVPVVRMVHDHDLYCMRGYKYHPVTRQICTRPASGYCMVPCGAMIARDRSGKFPVQWISYTSKMREIALNRKFARVIVASTYMKEELARNGFNAAHIEIHPPVPRSAELNVQPTFAACNRLVYAGQVIRGKGVDVLLESLALVRSPFECFILGDGSHRAYCQQLSDRLGLGDRVKFVGFVSQGRIAEYYRDATAALMSSVWPEPFGAVGLEAMRYGLPVVAFDAGGIREWLLDGWNGFLIPWMNRERYAGALDELLNDKELARRMGTHAKDWVGQRFAFPKYIDGLEDLFQRVAHSAQQRAATAAPVLI
jgi:glycosyltransferase involved in cell wall biosynthesis